MSEQEQRTVVKSSSLEICKTQTGHGSELCCSGWCVQVIFPGAFLPKLVMFLVGSSLSKCCWLAYQSRGLHRLFSDKIPVLLLNYMSLCQFFYHFWDLSDS